MLKFPPYLLMLNYASYNVGDVVIIEDIRYPEPDWDNKEFYINGLYVVTRIDPLFNHYEPGKRNVWLTPLFGEVNEETKKRFRFSTDADSRNFWLAYTKIKIISRREAG